MFKRKFKLFNRKRRGRSKHKKGLRPIRRFFLVVFLSALVSFLGSSWVMNPQLFQMNTWVQASTTQTQTSNWAAFKDKLLNNVHPYALWEKASQSEWLNGHLTAHITHWWPEELSWAALSTLVNGSPAQAPVPEPALLPLNEPVHYQQTRFSQCPHFFPEQRPIVPANKAFRELCFTPFAILHSGLTKTPVFVAQRLNKDMLFAAQKVKRNDRFYEEARLPRAERATLNDYRGSGYDRGHMAPAGDMHNEESMAQSFSLANVVPQNARHNRGAWSKIEQDTRKYIMRAKGDVYVFTGPVYETRPKTIGEKQVAVPSYLFKVVYDATTGKSWVHWHKNSENTQVGKPISYAEFVQRTGLHLLPFYQ